MKKADTAVFLPLLLAMAVTTGCAVNAERTEDDRMFGKRVPAEFMDANGEAVGSAVLTETPNGVLVDVELRDLEPGWHGFHVHEHGSCIGPDFTSAGAHYNPGNRMHGLMITDGPHAGDLPNIFVDADGTARFQAFAADLSLNGGDGMSDADGSAIVIHSDADDYRSQASGESGERIACAEID